DQEGDRDEAVEADGLHRTFEDLFFVLALTELTGGAGEGVGDLPAESLGLGIHEQDDAPVRDRSGAPADVETSLVSLAIEAPHPRLPVGARASRAVPAGDVESRLVLRHHDRGDELGDAAAEQLFDRDAGELAEGGIDGDTALIPCDHRGDGQLVQPQRRVAGGDRHLSDLTHMADSPKVRGNLEPGPPWLQTTPASDVGARSPACRAPGRPGDPLWRFPDPSQRGRHSAASVGRAAGNEGDHRTATAAFTVPSPRTIAVAEVPGASRRRTSAGTPSGGGPALRIGRAATTLDDGAAAR